MRVQPLDRRRRAARRRIAAAVVALTAAVVAVLVWRGVRPVDAAVYVLAWLLITTAVTAGTVTGLWLHGQLHAGEGT